jgi:iron complex outermembrane receptor protein
MHKLFCCVAALFFATIVNSQHVLKIKVFNADNHEPLQASLHIQTIGKLITADSTGMAQFENLPAGKYKLLVSHVGFTESEISFTIPFLQAILEVELEPKEEEEEEVIIQSTRSSRTIRDIPTRVEFIAGEELDEKANMKPGDIRMVLTESTGIQTQQTSATSANASIRIQGLDGRYTQLLKDGFPLYGGFSSGLGLLQTAPLDLKQFEVIKGSASTLYGGGAIAGLVNLISKIPLEERELKFHLDATSAGG